MDNEYIIICSFSVFPIYQSTNSLCAAVCGLPSHPSKEVPRSRLYSSFCCFVTAESDAVCLIWFMSALRRGKMLGEGKKLCRAAGGLGRKSGCCAAVIEDTANTAATRGPIYHSWLSQTSVGERG